MDERTLARLLDDVAAGTTPVEDAVEAVPGAVGTTVAVGATQVAHRIVHATSRADR